MFRRNSMSIFSIAAVMSFCFFGCDKNPSTLSQSSTGHGALTVSIVAQQGSPFRTIAKSAIARVSAPDMDTIKQALTITDSTVSGTVDNIPTGDNRRFEIFVYDSTKTIRYYGEAYSSVYGGQETYVTMILRTYYGAGDAFISGYVEDSIGQVAQPFYVTLTSPYNGQIFNIGDTIFISASVFDSFATIKSVSFYRDSSTLLGKVTKSPYTWKIPKAVRGTYRLWAKAVDSISDTAISPSVTVTVQTIVPNLPPTVSITSPVNGAVFNAGDTVIINATAKDSDGSVINVEFLVDSIYAGNDSIAPFQDRVTGLLAGTHKIQAIAFDNKGATGVSAIVSITVNGTPPANKPPVVSITSPVNNSTLYLGDTLKVAASASDPDGYVRSVKFYRDSTLLATDSIAPYAWSKVNPTTGTCRLHAVATDNSGASTTSSIVTVTILATRRP